MTWINWGTAKVAHTNFHRQTLAYFPEVTTKSPNELKKANELFSSSVLKADE